MSNYEESARSGSDSIDNDADPSGDAAVDWTSDWFPKLYDELRALAHSQRRRFHNPDGPGTTSILHEAYERLNQASGAEPEHPLHFYRTAARAMRSVLIDNARRSRAVRHGGHLKRVGDEALELVSVQRSDELLALDESLDALAEADAELAELVHLRIFGGLTVDELATLLGRSPATIKRRWTVACTLLHEHLMAGRES
jgi:RNA polymerase sigma factor (TIGR02999 family)